MLPGTIPATAHQIEFIGAQVFSSDVGGVSTTLNVSGARGGDLIVLAFSFDSGSSTGLTVSGIPFSAIESRPNEVSPGSYLGRAIWDGTTNTISLLPDNLGADFRGLSCVIAVFRGVNTLVNSATATGVSGMPDGPSVSGSGMLHLVSGHLDDDEVTMTAPSGWRLAASENSNDGGGNVSTTAIAYNFAGLSNPGSFGGAGSDDWRATTTVWR